MQTIQRIRRRSASSLVHRDLVRCLKSGAFPNQMLPSEDDISTMFGVSRTTVRDALANLENSGYISRVQGRGTMINQTICSLTGRVSEGQPFTSLIQSQNMTPSVQNSKAEKRPITDHIRAALHTDATEMYRIEKLFLGNDMPIILSVNYFSTDFLTDELLDCPMDDTPLLQLLQSRFSFPDVAYDVVNIRPIQADAHLAQKLCLPEHTPMLMFESISMDANEQPLLVKHEFYHPDKIQFCEVRSTDYRGALS